MSKAEKNIYIIIRESLKEEFRHMAIPQMGASVIATNDAGQVLLVKKANGNKWVIPGGVQELGEDFRVVAKRELLEETGIDYDEKELILVDILTGEGRHKTYPNGDEVYNNSVLFWAQNVAADNIDISGVDYADDGSGNYEIIRESTEYGWFDLINLPIGFDDMDMITAFINFKEKCQCQSRIK